MQRTSTTASGFTLIEMSIVLVIIGLIVGGILGGQDLIRAAGVRATISQIEQYNTAVNTFYGKFGYLPGDIPATTAVQFGLSASVAARSWSGLTYGNGDGVLQMLGGSVGLPCGGENYLFWADLSAARLISESPTSCDIASDSGGGDTGGCYFPAKIGEGNVIYVFSGFWNGGEPGGYFNSINYFGLSTQLVYQGGGWSTSNPGLTVAQAYAIDTKMDDGLPQSGHVIAAYVNVTGSTNGYGADYGAPVWVNPGGWGLLSPYYGTSPPATPGTSSTCYDNGNTAGATQRYSVGQNNGGGGNCALSFEFQ